MIYFMQPTAGGPVKIGHAGNVDIRHAQLESHYGCELVVLATMDGGRDEEAEIHERFAHLRLKGKNQRGRRPEQFRPAPELMEFIGRPLLVGANPDATEAMKPSKSTNTRAIRLDLPPKVHRLLRLMAADAGMSMAAYAREAVGQIVKDEARKRGLIP